VALCDVGDTQLAPEYVEWPSPTLTLRGIDDSLEHQRNKYYKEQVIDKEFRCAPEGWRRALRDCIGAGIFGGRSCVGISRSDCSGGKASVKGIQRINPPEPGENGGHFMKVAWPRSGEIEVGVT
jgi:hypothetical protein